MGKLNIFQNLYFLGQLKEHDTSVIDKIDYELLEQALKEYFLKHFWDD